MKPKLGKQKEQNYWLTESKLKEILKTAFHMGEDNVTGFMIKEGGEGEILLNQTFLGAWPELKKRIGE